MYGIRARFPSPWHILDFDPAVAGRRRGLAFQPGPPQTGLCMVALPEQTPSPSALQSVVWTRGKGCGELATTLDPGGLRVEGKLEEICRIIRISTDGLERGNGPKVTCSITR